MNAALNNSDLVEFMQLPAEVRREVQLWMARLPAVKKPICQSLARIAREMGVSLATARRKYDAWRSSHNWRDLVNRAKVPEDRGLDPVFIDFWKTLCQQNGRKCKPAYRKFVRQFKAGEMIPGMEHGIARDILPPGYSYDNLMRYKPTGLELKAARIGRGAAADHRPKIFTSRQGLVVGARYVFDDMWHDFEIVKYPQRTPMRLLQLHAHDLLSGCQFARGLKPRIQDEETGKNVGLKESEMEFLVAHVLASFGYSPDGCVLMVEHGTAAIKEALERLLYDLSGGKITVDRSGIDGASAFAGQYDGRGKGNFRFKASLESLGNLIHNETADLLMFPGQTGSNARINLPEELAGRKDHAKALMSAMITLPATVRNLLRLPFLESTQAQMLVHEVMERINQRTDHELEGWLECGFTTTDLELPGVGILPMEKFLALPPDKQLAVKAIAAPLPRKLSPREVFNLGARHLVKFRAEQSARLLHARQGVEVSVGKDHLITFEDQLISPEPLRYLAHHFSPGDKFRAVVNPFSTDTLHLFDARGGWIGAVNAWQRVSQVDSEALHRQMGAAATVEKELLQPLARRGNELTRERLEMTRNNIGVLKNEKDSLAQAEQDANDALMEGHR